MFSRVLHVPSLQNNPLSVISLTTKHGFTVSITAKQFSFVKDGVLAFVASIKNGVGYLNGATTPNADYAFTLSSTPKKGSKFLWYLRLAHMGPARVDELPSMSEELVINDTTPLPLTCKHCIAGKQHRDPFPKESQHRSTPKLELVVSDLHGPIDVQTHQGYRYWITVVFRPYRLSGVPKVSDSPLF